MNLNLTLDQLIWAVPLALLVLAVLQVLYLLLLNYAPVRREAPPRVQEQPSAPIMPPIRSGGGDMPIAMPPPQPTVVLPGTTSNALSPGAATRQLEGIGKFVIVSGVKNPGEIPLPSNHFTIGRFVNTGSNVLIGLDEKSISRKHATFICDDQLREYYLVDMHSSFGTSIMINGQLRPLTPDQQERVYNEDLVQFGSVVRVRLVLPTGKRG